MPARAIPEMQPWVGLSVWTLGDLEANPELLIDMFPLLGHQQRQAEGGFSSRHRDGHNNTPVAAPEGMDGVGAYSAVRRTFLQQDQPLLERLALGVIQCVVASLHV